MESFTTCLENIGGNSILFPGYNTNNIVTIGVQVSINNLIAVDELTNSVTFDFMCLLEWYDFRLAMPELVAEVARTSLQTAEQLATIGIDITQAVNGDDIYGQQASIWLPSLMFPGTI